MQTKFHFFLSYLAASVLANLIFSFSLLAQSDGGCILRRDQDSIKVFTCHMDDSKFKSIKASFFVNTTFSQLASMVLDIEGYKKWQYNTINPRILKTISAHEIIYYVEVEAPWPISNRDMVIHLTMLQDAITHVLTITANGEPDYLPKKDGLIRVPMSASKWVVTPVAGKHRLLVEYAIQIDPGGAVPAWMVNMVAADAPHTSYKNFREQIKSHAVNRSLTFLKD